MSRLLNGLARVGPKRLVKYLASIIPDEPQGIVINFDLTASSSHDIRWVNHQLQVWCGTVLQFERFGPGGQWPSWTVRFYRRSSAENFLRTFHLLDDAKLEDYEVKR